MQNKTHQIFWIEEPSNVAIRIMFQPPNGVPTMIHEVDAIEAAELYIEGVMDGFDLAQRSLRMTRVMGKGHK